MTPTTHPLATAYLDELEALLSDLPAAERGDVLIGIRDHLDEALGSDPSDERVRAVLAELGPASRVAEEAYASSDTPRAAPAAASEPPRRSWSEGRWVPAVVATGFALILLIVTLGIGGLASVTHPFELLFSLVFVMPLVAPLAILVLISELWTGREKALLVAIVPLAVVTLTLGVAVNLWTSSYVGAWVALAVILIGGGWLLARLTAAGMRRAH